MIDVIGAPFDGAGASQGSRLGPAALEIAGLREALESTGQEVGRWINLAEPVATGPATKLRGLECAIHEVEALRPEVLYTLRAGNTPLVLGGEHTISLGAVSAALEFTDGDLAVLWIDAHADVNTPSISPTGHLHGMPLAALMGLPSGSEGAVDSEWQRLVDVVSKPSPLAIKRTGWFGLRDVDAGEGAFIRTHVEALAVTMNDIDRQGIVASVERMHDWLRHSGARNLWISFDVDVLDPILAPGTGTAVRGGLSYREAHLLAELIYSMLGTSGAYTLLGLDVVEVNPLEDLKNSTARVVSEWIASLFGKTILGGSR